MCKFDFYEKKFIYIVLYKISGYAEWRIFEEGVFVTEIAAKEAEDHIFQDYRGGVQTRIEKRRVIS